MFHDIKYLARAFDSIRTFFCDGDHLTETAHTYFLPEFIRHENIRTELVLVGLRGGGFGIGFGDTAAP